jgi:16S rRNA (guanine527-N7)-methyltransferase
MDFLESGLEKLGLPDNITNRITRNDVIRLLERYIREIETFNDAYGLVKVKDRNELVIKHILDSLAPLEIIARSQSVNPGGKLKTKIADIGSGAGLPGIPLAVCLPDAEITLMERMGRRAGFLRNCIAVLDMHNLRVEEAEMEKAGRHRFDIAVFRAFRPLTVDILKGLLRLVVPGGFLAAWKGRLEKTEEEMETAGKLFPGLKWEIIPVNVPFLDEERHLAVFRNVN